MSNPKRIVLISGKRKSGKDFVAESLGSQLTNSSIIRLSEPLKREYAQKHDLDLSVLLSSDAYKECYRKAMVDWSDAIRKATPGYFCELALPETSVDIWIVADCRRPSDIEFFRHRFVCPIITVRIEASLEVRQVRGFSYTPGIDDADTECALDAYDFDMRIVNNGKSLDLARIISFSEK